MKQNIFSILKRDDIFSKHCCYKIRPQRWKHIVTVMQKINNLAISFEDDVKSELWGLNEMTNKLGYDKICSPSSHIKNRNIKERKSWELSYYIHFCISINFCNTISFHSMCTFVGNIWAYFGLVCYLSSQSFVVDF